MFVPFVIILLLLDFFFQRGLGFKEYQAKSVMGKTKAQIAAHNNKRNINKNANGTWASKSNSSSSSAIGTDSIVNSSSTVENHESSSTMTYIHNNIHELHAMR